MGQCVADDVLTGSSTDAQLLLCGIDMSSCTSVTYRRQINYQGCGKRQDELQGPA